MFTLYFVCPSSGLSSVRFMSLRMQEYSVSATTMKNILPSQTCISIPLHLNVFPLTLFIIQVVGGDGR